jgi:hypothetical protein
MGLSTIGSDKKMMHGLNYSRRAAQANHPILRSARHSRTIVRDIVTDGDRPGS